MAAGGELGRRRVDEAAEPAQQEESEVGAGLILVSILASIAWAFLIAVAFHEHGDGWWEDGPRSSYEMPFDSDVAPGMPDRPGSDG